jgi:hypothetical protein
LSQLGRREFRDEFVRAYLHDLDMTVRKRALVDLSELFRGERDREILGMALSAFDDVNSEVGLRLAAGAVMMYQLGVDHDDRGCPAWWDEQEEDLDHPSIQEAVRQTRRLLGEGVRGSASQ